MNAYITIDTDNACIRLYEGRARADRIPDTSLRQLHHDLSVIAYTLTGVTGCRFSVEVMR